MTSKRFVALILMSFVVRLEGAALWNDDKSSDNFNCFGSVTDAVCCHDELCDGKDEAACKSEGKRSMYCQWSPEKGKCLAYRDKENNVCCQSEPAQGCSEASRGICPENWQVPEGCCDSGSSQWNGTLSVTKEGHVCCDDPCEQLEKNGCTLTDHCGPTERSFAINNPMLFGYNQLVANKYMHYPYHLGQMFPRFEPPKEAKGDDKSLYEAKEITVTDIMDMLITALEQDTDVIEYDKSLYKDPNYGKYYKYNDFPLFYNYVDPEIFLNKVYSFNGLQGFQPTGNFPQQMPGFGMPWHQTRNGWFYGPQQNQAGWNQNQNQGAWNQNQAGWNQNQPGWNQNQAGLSQNQNQGGWNQHQNQAGWNQNQNQAGWNQNQGGWNQNQNQAGWNQNQNQAGWNQNQNQGGWNQNQGGWNQQNQNPSGWNQQNQNSGINQGQGQNQGQDGFRGDATSEK